MNNKVYPSYSIAIRTLGTAGEKYLETLRSCDRQTLQADNILVYIPHDYKLPKETIGKEIYIRCDKGMVAQRSTCSENVKSDYILFLDDDLSFNADFVQLLFDGLLGNSGDCISPDIYSVHNNSILIKIRDFLGGTWPHFSKQWSFKIRRCTHYSYNPSPSCNVLKSQSGAGACALCRKDVYENIHFADERWMDKIRYALGDDQVFFYKMYKYGFNLLTSFNAKLVHLDAGSGHEKSKSQFAFSSAYCRFLIWHRTIYLEKQSLINKLICLLALIFSYLFSLPLRLAVIIKNQDLSIFTSEIKGYYKAVRYVNTKEYKSIPSYYRGC